MMNIQSPDSQRVGFSTKAAAVSRGDVYAALAYGGMSHFEQQLYIYYHTLVPDCRSACWALLLERIADMAVKEKWGTRKHGILNAMANQVLEHLINPRRNHLLSDRQLANILGFKNHVSIKAYKPRYNRVLSYAKSIINRGDEILLQQL